MLLALRRWRRCSTTSSPTARALSWQFLTSYPSRARRRGRHLPAIVGSLRDRADGAHGRARRRRRRPSTSRNTARGRLVAAHRDQHRQPRRRAVDHLRAARARAVRARDGAGPERAGRRRDAGAARAAGRDPVHARGAARRAEVVLREGSYALGATKWQTIWHQVLPAALPGILTGLILALSRAIGETAPLITIGALTYVPFAPDSLWSPFTVLPIQIFNWVSRPQAGVPAERRRRHPRAARAAAGHERASRSGPRSLSEAGGMTGMSRLHARRAAEACTRDRAKRALKIDVRILLRRARSGDPHRANRHGVHRPVGCGKSTFLRTLNRMNDIIPGTRVEGSVKIDGQDIYAPRHRRRRAAPARRHGVPEVEPVPEVDLRERRLRPAHQRPRGEPRRSAERASRRACTQAALWDEVKDRLHESALALSGGQQQRSASRGRWRSSPRVLLMDEPASALDPIATQRIEELIYELKKASTRSSSSRTTCSRRRASRTTPRSSGSASWSSSTRRTDLHRAGREADGGLRHRAIRIQAMERRPRRTSRRSSTGSRRACSRWAASPRSASASIQALVERDSALVEEVLGRRRADQPLHIEIDDRCFTLLALHQPMATDLRPIVAAVKINTDLERVGDLAVNIAEAARAICNIRRSSR